MLRSFMEKRETLSDYMFNSTARNKAFVSDDRSVYIVKDFQFSRDPSRVAIIDAHLITPNNNRKRVGLPLGGIHSHLDDRKATFSDIREAILG